MMMFVSLLFSVFLEMRVEAGSIYTSPYVELSPDGQAWTTCPGDTHNYGYDEGYSVETGVESSLRTLQPGEHYYKYDRTGDIPVGEWVVEWENAACIHILESEGYHGLTFGDTICGSFYTQGWYAYCADCHQRIAKILMYMCEDAAKSITSIPMGMDYYYLCPICTHLEQGAEIEKHECEKISWNRYKIQYRKNIALPLISGGEPLATYHMYNNATEYEGKKVTPNTKLAKMNGAVFGYEFVGWNTKPDGSGVMFGDEQEIYNLTEYDSRYDNRGIITLYAQWKKSESTLIIDPAGGSYMGNSGVTSYTKQTYDSQILYPSTIVAPPGSNLHFETYGGSAVADIQATQRFERWEASEDFGGRLVENLYYFLGKNGSVDRLTAVYMPETITLPEAEKPNSSFGGWYYDEEYKKPAGIPGEKITIDRDTTLYAHWVELKLDSEENYSVNHRKGAVDLWWSQPDINQKAYRIYRYTSAGEKEVPGEDAAWTLINSTLDETVTLSVNETLKYSGASKTFTVPYTGIYSLTAAGAQGGNYGSYKGGLGGKAEGTFWLNAGDVITYTIGGQNGYNGGGKATIYGNGGGATTVVSAEKGVLLVAAGGGGATGVANGGAGGTTLSGNLLSTGCSGEAGMAGGGGGYKGGKSGEYVYHTHSAACGYHTHTGDSTNGGGCYGTRVDGETFYCNDGAGQFVADSYTEWCDEHQTYCSGAICNVCGEKSLHAGNYGHVWYGPPTWSLSCGKSSGWQCGKVDNVPESSKPAYGGSSYINTAISNSYSYSHGSIAGNGYLAVQSKDVGFVSEQKADGVPAPDLATPKAVSGSSVAIVPVVEDNKSEVIVSWAVPEDRGTDYFFMVESHKASTGEKLCASNIRMHTITTGVKGYLYVLDTSYGTNVTSANGVYIEEEQLQVSLTDVMQYLHIAPVDGAGNIGDTMTVRLGVDVVIPWPIFTEQINITPEEGIFPAADSNTFYVRCDADTPLELGFRAYMEGKATSEYQVTHTIFESQMDGAGTAQNIFITPLHQMMSDEIVTSGSELNIAMEGKSMLNPYLYMITTRSNNNQDLTVISQFLIGEDADGKTIRVTPMAGVVTEECSVYSDSMRDLSNSIYLIGDATPPMIQGAEFLEEQMLIDRGEGEIILFLQALDTVSGLQSFMVDIYNEDNGGYKSWIGDESGVITLNLTGESTLFGGDLTITMTAVDNVGNICEAVYHVTELALEAKVERILAPHEPIFKRGESGILSVETWGHAELVEVIFPEGLEEYDTVYNYAGRLYKTEEGIQFMIPLYDMKEDKYEITVRVHKGIHSLEKNMTIQVTGTILDELRTGLR